MSVKNIEDAQFAQEVEQGETVLVDFWAPWCGPCKAIAPVLEELAIELQGKVKIVKVNVDENPGTPNKYGVMSIPTLILFKNGEPVHKSSGFQGKGALVSSITPHL